MKIIINKVFFFLMLVSQLIIGQKNCVASDFQGKWLNEDFGVEISCNKMTILDKQNDWNVSEKREDTYYVIETIVNQEKSFIGGIRNFTTGEIITADRKSKKISTIQYRILKLQLIDDDTLSFTISEKSVKYANMPQANWVAIHEDEGLFEKTFILKCLVK